MVHVPPVHMHGVTPLQFNVQFPPVQFVMVHEVEGLWHVSVQSPPVQSSVQVPPVQSEVQSPPSQPMLHDVEPVHVVWQSPPVQVMVHTSPVVQV
jgi:hypothetical protein